MPLTPIRDEDVVTTGSKESLSLVTKTPLLVTKMSPSVAQDPDLAPAPPDFTSTDQDNILTHPIEVDNESSNSDDDDLTAKSPWINYPTYKTCGNIQANVKLNQTYGNISNGYKRIMRRSVRILTFASLMDAGRCSIF